MLEKTKEVHMGLIGREAFHPRKGWRREELLVLKDKISEELGLTGELPEPNIRKPESLVIFQWIPKQFGEVLKDILPFYTATKIIFNTRKSNKRQHLYNRNTRDFVVVETIHRVLYQAAVFHKHTIRRLWEELDIDEKYLYDVVKIGRSWKILN